LRDEVDCNTYEMPMMSYLEDCRTPGQLVLALLEKQGWTKRTLAIVLNVDESGINRIISDKQAISAAMALSFEDVFDVSAETFLSLQKDYDLAKARIAVRPDPKRKSRAQLFGGLPISEMVKRGWILVENPKDANEIEAAVTKFFRAEESGQIYNIPHAAKKANSGPDITLAQHAWLHRVRRISEDMLVARYSDISGGIALKKLSLLRRHPEELRKIPRIMNEAGIRFVLVEALSSTKIDGACLWLSENEPVIGMSMRYDRIDNFWFVLRHEIEHVLRGHGKDRPVVDVELEGRKASLSLEISKEEREANEAAAGFCVPSDLMDAFIARKSPFFAERDLLGFANTMGIHPGLVAGQVQHRTGRYDLFRKHLVKVKRYIAPSAIVDGWGDIAPIGY